MGQEGGAGVPAVILAASDTLDVTSCGASEESTQRGESEAEPDEGWGEYGQQAGEVAPESASLSTATGQCVNMEGINRCDRGRRRTVQ